ncbi:MAG: hypothetical protein JO204_18480 [Alphaproteobacteria bacterium]|nr:hypothetical protein [Alphaproteobacteria bacterium]
MALSDWTELENLSGEIADSQSRLAAARSTQNHGLVKLLERQISDAEKWRDRLLHQITARLTGPGMAARREPPTPTDFRQAAVERGPDLETAAAVAPAPEATPAATPPAEEATPAAEPAADRPEGADAVWEHLSRTDIERVKRELGVRRAEMLARHAEELRALDAEQTEIDTFEQAIDAFARKFNVAGPEVVVPFDTRGQARG